ncbi:cleavage and polyadenylation specificity factor subunit 2 [Nematocida major]|uniref:cleavage and polyadenylation specificity factor subunit 2 n=1 Tax=Nematocida major TaxID=1912982 RepID=UPI002008A0E9|nr:cleavage and polyadenylation specificity factor subunit 2 [Nematocida major]KAH9386214.1 cleavage and polyadenylation specificity factor subunit 2 [Nematocida major]
MEDGITVVHVPRKKKLDSCCAVVEIDNLRVLVNFGTEYDLSLDVYEDLEFLKEVTHIIVCSSEISSLGGLIHLKSLGVCAPIYGTVPIKILGRIEMLERVKVLEKFHGVSLGESRKDEVFDRIIPLKYTQTVELSENVTVGPLNSGSSVGGAVWKIRKGEQEWIVCDRVNHRREAHLDGIDVFNISKPSGVFINSTPVLKEQTTRKARDKALVQHVLNTINRNGKVFIPTGYSQLLEIAMTLHNYKETQDIPMALFSFYGRKYFDMVKTILEWTGSAILHTFNQEKENPFNLLNIRFYDECANSSAAERIIFVIDMHGDSGFSPVLLPGIAKDSRNLILNVRGTLQYTKRVSTDPTEKETDASQKESSHSSDEKAEDACTMQLCPIKYTRLSNTEVETEYKRSKKRHDEQEAQKKIDSLVKQKIEDSSEEEEDRSQIFCRFWHELQDEIETKEAVMSYLDFDVKCAGGELLFPNPSRRKQTDEYGEPLQMQKEKEEEKEIEVVLEPDVVQKKVYRISVGKPQNIKIRASVQALMFSSESDIFNLKVVLAGMEAEKIVVYGEDPMYRKVLQEYFLYSRASADVMELVNRQAMAGVRHAVPLKMRNDVLSKIKMQKLGSSLIGYISGRIEKSEKTAVLEIKEDEEGDTTEDICIGTARISELRQIFIDAKIKADVIGEKLVVSEGITIQFDGHRLMVEGDVSKELYAVKKLLSESVAYLHAR